MSTSTSKSNSLVLCLVSGAPLGVAFFGLLLGLGMPPVAQWFWPAPTTNAAEAALLGDAARVRQLAAEGAFLDRPMPIRSELREGDVPAVMAPLEAARRRGHDDVVDVLIELGMRPAVDAATAAP